MIVRRRVVRALLACCLMSTLVVGGCSSSTDRSAPSMADVRALLAGHGAAVLHHNRDAFAADLDTAGPAATFRALQLRAFANLSRLPLSTWSYRVEGRTDFHQAESAAARRFGTGAIIVRISLRFAFREIDQIPTTHDLWWTFVRDDGRVVIAADDGLANAGGVSWQGPWDFGKLDVLRGPHSLVLGHPDNAAVLPEVQAAVDAAVPAVTAVWGSQSAPAVLVAIPSSDPEFAALAGQSPEQVTDQVAAVAVSDGQDPLRGTVYGQRLIVNVAAFARLSAVGRRIVIRHEITHLATESSTTADSPQWLIEGFAEYVGNLGSGQPVTTTAAELRTDIRHGRLPTTLPTPDAFSTQGKSARAYEGAWLACRLIAQHAGEQGLVRFYRLVGASPFGPDVAVADALRFVLHETTAAFIAQWRAYLRAELGS
ncbi:MAG TPA: hypothetical protein VE442_15110 [Jatrophihabitans sp.]|nr:hypothetical protein [Jatrophihabitans sp.]